MRRYLGTALAVVVVGLTLAAEARADLVNWSYSWSPDSSWVVSDNGESSLSLSSEGSSAATGNSYVVATQLSSLSSTPAGTPDTFTAKVYGLTLTLTDVSSSANGTLHFTGEFGGALSASNAKITNAFTGQTTQTIILGANLYTVTIGPFVPPGPPGSGNAGGIGAFVTVAPTGNANPASVPEPSSLILAALGMAAGWAARRRLRDVAVQP